MEQEVIRIFSSTPPPMEDGAEEEDQEFGDFGTFSGVPNSVSFSEFDTPTTFNQNQALTATSPPELLSNRGVGGLSRGAGNELSKANGVVPVGRLGCTPPLERTETKKAVSDCNGEGPEALTNGFASLDVEGSPPSQNSVHLHIKGTSTEDTGVVPEDDFADFAAFSDGHMDQTADSDRPLGGSDLHLEGSDLPLEGSDPPLGGSDLPLEGSDLPLEGSDLSLGGSDLPLEGSDLPLEGSDFPLGGSDCPLGGSDQQGTVSDDDVRDTNRTGVDSSGSDSPDGGRLTDSPQRDEAFPPPCPASDAVLTNSLTLNGSEEAAADCGDSSPGDSEVGPADEKFSETETETSFGHPLSTDALEEYGDISTTGSAPSPPPQSDTATPAEDDEDFGDFGDAGGFADFEVQQDRSPSRSSDPVQEAANAGQDDDFGDFNSPGFHSAAGGDEEAGMFASFPVSDSFGNFSSAEGGGADAGWSAFGEQPEEEEESWAAFGAETSVAPPEESREEEDQEEVPPVGDETSRTEKQQASLSGRLEKLFHCSFPPTASRLQEDPVASLTTLLDPAGGAPDVGAEKEGRSPCRWSGRGGVWIQLQDIHEALGLRYQWGGSYCNKALLCCLGIDTRNILFTGQKKQPVIVPMYAAGLGMLEPTKEPAKPVSAAEMIASIAQAPPAAPEKTPCSSDSVQQEALPPVQFDWSSSGLTNPLDASGGSSLLNLDFFGPVEDSGSSSSTSIPGVDPELFELTTAKLDPSVSGSRVADAFARLMSTMEKTSTSTRKPKKDENLSEEASKVIAALPDLSFMQAKVLMFPTTLTPLHSQATPD